MMSEVRRRYALKAKLVKTLVLFDGPQVALLETDRDLDMLAVACEKNGFIYPLFGVEISKRTLRRYLEERIDLNYAFRFKEAFKQYYFFDWSKLRNMEVELTRASRDDISNIDYYPEPGFFARNHTVEFSLAHLVPSAVRSFNIDGKWDASDFSRFYGKIADVYAFAVINSKSVRDKLGAIDIANLKNAIADYVWKGGGSYVSFYSNLFETVRLLNPLDVSRISYASPGTIEIKGGAEALDEVSAVLNIFDGTSADLAAAYNLIEKLLIQEKLRGSDKNATFSSDRVADYAFQLTRRFALQLGIQEPDELLQLCSGNILVFVKIVLSYYRRGRDLSRFHAEGRVQQTERSNVGMVVKT